MLPSFSHWYTHFFLWQNRHFQLNRFIQFPIWNYFSFQVWTYSLTLSKYKYMHLLYAFFLHMIPALIVDGCSMLIGKKPRLAPEHCLLSTFDFRPNLFIFSCLLYRLKLEHFIDVIIFLKKGLPHLFDKKCSCVAKLLRICGAVHFTMHWN